MPSYPLMDPELTFEARAADLVSRLTLEEKAAQMLHNAPAIERLGIPAYNWWNECLHGVARAGIATVFPQAIGLAAMFCSERLGRVARAIADEARAKHHEALRHGDRGLYRGLTFWSPNVNIFRDPRWGRGQETFGECPFLTARLGVEFCKALQGDDPRYLKLVATPKHFAAHSGPEAARHRFDARVSLQDLYETYLPAFHACITEAKAHSIMAAYNRTNGEPCSASATLLRKILREEWGFDGYVVSDCWAVRDLHEHHHVTQTPEESAARAVEAGCDLNCGCTYEALPEAVRQGLLSEAALDRSVSRLFLARLRLGMFDDPERVPFANIPYEINDCEVHRALARQVARDSMVLLKNAKSTLPLSRNLRSIAVIGPNANERQVLLGNYHGTPSDPITPLDGIRRAVAEGCKVWYTPGCKLLGTDQDGLARAGDFPEAVSMAERADVIVLCLGLSAQIEGEEGDAGNSEAAGDRLSLALPGLQQELLERLCQLEKPLVLVVLSGSPVDLHFAHEHAAAILQAWYPGEQAGHALADLLFGDVSPAGRLPLTFPRCAEDLPPFEDYNMRGRTYRYLDKEPLYPFGFGLSYSRFEYSGLLLQRREEADGPEVQVTASVQNTGARAADEVVQLYVETPNGLGPRWELRGFQRISLGPGETRMVRFLLPSKALSHIEPNGRRLLAPGKRRIYLGGSQPDTRSIALMGHAPLCGEVELTGEPRPLAY